jgi:hypothetical protein
MANRCHLLGCLSDADALTRAIALFAADKGPAADGAGPELAAPYLVPLFWLAAFDRSTPLVFDRKFHSLDGTETTQAITVYWSTTEAAVSRLKARKECVLQLAGGIYRGFYDEWIAYVGSSYPSALILQAEDLMCMLGFQEITAAMDKAMDGLATCSVPDLRASLDVLGSLRLEPSDGRSRTPEETADFRRAALAGFAWAGGSTWPTPPSASEVSSLPSREAQAPSASKAWWRFWR